MAILGTQGTTQERAENERTLTNATVQSVKTGQKLADQAVIGAENLTAQIGNEDRLLGGGVPEDFQIPTEQFDYLRDSYESQAEGFSAALSQLLDVAEDQAIDPNELTGILSESFARTSNQIINATQAQNRKAMLELDSYLGSSTSDARSAVRFRLARDVTNSILADSYQAVDQVYSDYAQSLVNAKLSAAQINAPFKLQQAQYITALAQSGVQLYDSMASATNNAYMANLEAATGWVNANLQLYQTDAQVQIQREAGALEWAKLGLETQKFVEDTKFFNISHNKWGGLIRTRIY